MDSISEWLKAVLSAIWKLIIITTWLLLILYVISKLPYIDILDKNHQAVRDNIGRIYDGSFVILTVTLICCAWFQLQGLNKTSKADFLLQIVARYSSAEIVEARAVIQRLFRAACPKDHPVAEEIYIQRMSDEIDRIRYLEDPLACKDFALLLNLLDFLEAISYFTRRGFITVKDIDELIGNSILFYFKVYKSWIYSRRQRYNNSDYYCEFERLAKKIESHLLKEKLTKTCFIFRFLNLFY